MERFEIQFKDERGLRIIMAERVARDNGVWVFFGEDDRPMGRVVEDETTSILSTKTEPLLEEPRH